MATKGDDVTMASQRAKQLKLRETIRRLVTCHRVRFFNMLQHQTRCFPRRLGGEAVSELPQSGHVTRIGGAAKSRTPSIWTNCRLMIPPPLSSWSPGQSCQFSRIRLTHLIGFTCSHATPLFSHGKIQIKIINQYPSSPVIYHLSLRKATGGR